MIKKTVLAIFAVVICVAMLAGCTADMGGGGAPTPLKNNETNYSEAVSVPKLQIKMGEAEKVLAELISVMTEMNKGTLYLSDITYMSNVSDYLAQYNQFDTEIAAYMESVRKLLSSYCSLYAKNIGSDKVREQINEYVDGYFGMSEEFRLKYGYIDNAALLDIMNKVEIMANVSSDVSSK